MPVMDLQITREMFAGSNRRPTIVLLTSVLGIAAFHEFGRFRFWSENLPTWLELAGNRAASAAVVSLASTVFFLGLVPLLVVKCVLRERLADYGVCWGDLRLATIWTLLAAPVVVYIGYRTGQMPEFQAVYPIHPPALDSMSFLIWHLAGQIFWYAAWEFHFRGFLQNGIGQSHGVSTGIWVQTLTSTLAHFGRPTSEVFASILAGVFWGILAARTRSLLGGFLQHWLLGAALDYFIFRAVTR